MAKRWIVEARIPNLNGFDQEFEWQPRGVRENWREAVRLALYYRYEDTHPWWDKVRVRQLHRE